MTSLDFKAQLQKDYPPLLMAEGKGGGAFWIFDLTGLSKPQISYVFPRGVAGKYQVGEDRLIQRYLEQAGYEVLVITQPFFLRSKGRQSVRLETISFWNLSSPSKSRDAFLATAKKNPPLGVAFGRMGRVEISVKDILAYVNDRLALLAPEKPVSTLSITDSSKHVWQDLSTDMRGVIHTWLQNGPVFRPETYITKPTRGGCKLSVSDQVAVGLLYGMFSFGVKHDAIGKAITLDTHEFDPLKNLGSETGLENATLDTEGTMWG